jgi:ABC-2 type transport system permease protein
MTGTYLRSEIRRTFRNPRYLIFALAMPLILFGAFGAAQSHNHLSGITVSAYIMVSMATFGAMSTVFSTGGAIAFERAIGWNRQLRITALTGRAYVAGKGFAGFAVAVPSLVLVFLAGALLSHVHLSAGRWLLTGVSILLALLPVAALGIWVGYMAKAQSVQAISGGVYSLLSLLGGLWVPVTVFPHWVLDIVKALPIYWVAQAGRQALSGSWVGWEGVAVLAVWTAILGAGAARAYKRNSASS